MKHTLITICLVIAALYCTAILLSRVDSADELTTKYMAAIAGPLFWVGAFWAWKAGQAPVSIATHAASPVVEAMLLLLVTGAVSLWVLQMEHMRSQPPKFKKMKTLPVGKEPSR